MTIKTHEQNSKKSTNLRQTHECKLIQTSYKQDEKKRKKTQFDKLPDEIRIGGTFDGEVDNATRRGLQDSTVPDTVPSSESFELDMTSGRKGPLQREKTCRKATVNNG